MEGIMSKLSQNGTTLFDDTSHRLKERSLSQPQSSNPGNLAQAPGRGQGFDDFGSSFGAQKPSRAPTRVRFDSDSEDEIDLLSSTQDVKRAHKAKSTSKGKGKAKADDELEGVVINGELLPFHEDYKPKKLPKINKIKRTTSADDTQPQPQAKSTARPTPKPAYLGSPSNPIPVAVKPKSKSKPLSCTSSRTSPLHDRSPNRPSQATSSRSKPRAANRGAKKPNTSSFVELSSPVPTDVDSPPKRKRECPLDGMSLYADKRLESSSTFPQLQPFPLLTNAKAKTFDSDSDKDDDDDELGIDPDDDILMRGGPRPFPMSTQVLQGIQRNGRLLSAGAADGEKRRDEDDDDDVFMAPLNYADTSQVDDSLFLDPSIDPSTLCPYCDEPLPPTPTPHLVALLASTLRKSYTDPRPTNPKGLKAPLTTFIAVCQRHQFESVQLPEAKRKKWPTEIRFGDVRGRVEMMKGRLEAIILGGGDDWRDSDSDEEDEKGREKGPRGKSVFWKEIMKEVKKKGSRAVVGVSGQFASFEKTQPGYYGELGSVIIHQTLYNLFPPPSFDPTLITPLTPTEFIQRILVPEAAVGLILEDRKLDPKNEKHREKAVKILRESAAYGVAMFPDADTNMGGSGKGKGERDDDDWDMGVGDEIVRERARARRKELEEEERVEEMWLKNEAERAKREGGGKKPKKVGESTSNGRRREKGKEREVVEISETSDAGRPRPRPRKVQRERSSVEMDNALLSSDASVETKGKRANARKKNDASKIREPADIDLCSSSSDSTTGRESRRKKIQGKEKAPEREASVESMILVYPSSDEMSVDGLEAIHDTNSATRRKRADKENKKAKESDSELELLYPSTSPTAKTVKPNRIVSLLSEDEETPRPKKAPHKFDEGRAPLSNPSSLTSSSAKSSFPLQIARDRRLEGRKAIEESVWKRHLSPQPSGIDDDGHGSDDSCASIRAYLKTSISPVVASQALEGQPKPASNVGGRRKDEYSWLLSQSSTTSTQSP